MPREDRLTALEEKLEKREEELAEQLAVLEENLAQIFHERDEQLATVIGRPGVGSSIRQVPARSRP